MHAESCLGALKDHWVDAMMRVVGAKSGWVMMIAACVLLHSVALFASDTTRVYRWTDDQGDYQYGDTVPPQYAENGHAVLNKQGVAIEIVRGKMTAAEYEELQRVAELKAKHSAKLAKAALRDKVLLSTYLSVNEIEALRDRRLELIDGQMRITQRYLDNLREKLIKLEREAQRYSPYSSKPNAKPIDEKLAREFSDTLNSILLYEKNLAKSREEQQQITTKFAADIQRFAELQGLTSNLK